jgi:hypothetical protein
MNMNEKSLLAQACSCLDALIDSSYLDATAMAIDCLTYFNDYEWQPAASLDDTQLQRWNELLQRGSDEDMSSSDLSEFLSLTSQDGQVHDYFHRVQARKLVDAIRSIAAKPENAIPANARELIERASKAAAANCMFDLESEDLNADVAKALEPDAIFDAVQASSSLDITIGEQEYALEPYWSFLSEDNATEILGDMQTAIESAMLEQYKSLTQCRMVDWRIAEGESVPDAYKVGYTAKVDIGNRIVIDINDNNGEPSIGLLIEINRGTPALHIDLDGGDNLIHIHKGQGGLVITPECKDATFDSAELDDLSYHSHNAVVIRP